MADVLPVVVIERMAEGAVASTACGGMNTTDTGEFGSSRYRKRLMRKRSNYKRRTERQNVKR